MLTNPNIVRSWYKCWKNTHYPHIDKASSSEKNGLPHKGQWVWNTLFCSHCCMLSLRGYLNSIICPTLENSCNKHWALQIFHEIYHKHKTHGISYKIQPYTVHVNKTIIDGPIPLTSVLSVTPKISVELKINSFSPLSVRQGPYTILKDLSLLPAWMTGKKRYKN